MKHLTEEREVDLILKIKKRIRIDKATSVSAIKQMARNVFGHIAKDLIIFIKDNEITAMERMNVIRTLDYCQTDQIILIPTEVDYVLSKEGRIYNDSGTGYLSGREFQSQMSYSQNIDEFERQVRENEIYRKNISMACVDIDELKKNIVALKVNSEDSSLVKARNILSKADDIISDSHILLNKFQVGKGEELKRLNSDPEEDKSFFNTNYKDRQLLNESKSRSHIPHSDSSTKITTRNRFERSKGHSDSLGSSNNLPNPNSGTRNSSRTRAPSNEKEINLLKEFKEENEYLKTKIENLNNKITDLQHQKLKWQDETGGGGIYDKIDEWQMKMEEIKTQLINTNLLNNKLNEDMEDLERLNKKLEMDNKKMINRMAEMEHELINLNQKCKSNNELYCTTINEIRRDYEKGLADLSDELNEKERIIEEYRMKIYSDEVVRVHSHRSSRDNITDENIYDKIKETLKSQFEDIHQKFDDNNSVNENLVKLNEHLNQKMIDLIEEIRKLNEKLYSKKIQLDNLARENSILSKQLQKSNSGSSEFKDENEINDNKIIIPENYKSQVLNSNLKHLKRDSRETFSEINVLNFEIISCSMKEVALSSVFVIDIELGGYKRNIHNKNSRKETSSDLEIENLPDQIFIPASNKVDKSNNSTNERILSSVNNPKIVSIYYKSSCSKRGNKNTSSDETYIVNSDNVGKSKDFIFSNFNNIKSNARKKDNHISSKSGKKGTKGDNNIESTNLKFNKFVENKEIAEKPNIIPENTPVKTEENNNSHTYKPDQTIESVAGSMNESDASVSIEINNKLFKNMDYKSIKNLTKYKNKSVKISDGALFLFRVYDKKRILRFNIENRRFKVIEFADFGNFEQNYNPQGSIYLNTFGGLFVVTGMNHDKFYFFNYKAKTMTKLAKLNDNHTFGSLVYYEKGNYLLCLSGWHNKKVERYANEEILSSFISTNSKLTPHKRQPEFLPKNSWSHLPEMKVERSECPYLIVNEVNLFAFFGFNCPRGVYVQTIEKLDLSKPSKWEEIKFKNESHLSTQIKSHSCVIVKGNVLFLGGFDGQHERPVENFFEFNLDEKSLIPIERKYPEIIFNHFYNFQNDSAMVPYVDIKNRLHFAGFDENDRVHSIEVNLMNYDIFKFD